MKSVVGASLELAVSQSLYAARLLERALYAESGWTMVYGSIEVPAQREVTDEGITFTVVFPETCYLATPPSNVSLKHEGEIVGIRAIDHPGDTQFVVSWEILARVPVPC